MVQPAPFGRALLGGTDLTADGVPDLVVAEPTEDGTSSVWLVDALAPGIHEIEEVAAKTPEKILKEAVDPVVGLAGYQARNLAYGLGLHGAAAKNAGELIDSLTLAMNRARKAEITQEILEVVAGADALTT